MNRRRTNEEEIRLLMKEAGPGLSYQEARMLVGENFQRPKRHAKSMSDWRRDNPIGDSDYPPGYMQGRGAA